MKYKIISYEGEKFYFENKQELFQCFDFLIKRDYYGWCGSLQSRFTEKGFEYYENSSRGFNIGQKEVQIYNKFAKGYYNSVVTIQVNALYKLYTEKNVAVCIEEIFYEYKQSRGIKEKVYKPYYCDRSTQRYRKKWKSYYKDKSNAFRKEYRDNISAFEEGIRIRASRAHEVKMQHVYCYDDYFYYRETKKSWKDYKKNKKQWMKNQSKR